MSSYNVRLWEIKEYKGKRKSTYRVRWTVAGQEFGETFSTRPLAESFLAKLRTATREGVPFDEACGLPEPMARALNSKTWYEHACAYVDMKWPRASGKHRTGIAESLTTATMALLTTERGAPPDEQLRAALYGWAYNAGRRKEGPPPDKHASAIRWLETNTVRLIDLAEPALVRKVLDALSITLDGRLAAASTMARKRAVFSNALLYAVELRALPSHPMAAVGWKPTKTNEEVDRRVVANHAQAKALFRAVEEIYPELGAFFASMFYSALRPEEALQVRDADCELPADDEEWGTYHLTGATVNVGRAWSDDGTSHEDRGLKHRSAKATRDVPIPPPLVKILRAHRGKYPPGRDGRLFVSRRGPGGTYFPTWPGSTIPNNTYPTVWKKARERALTADQAASPLAARPYDLRHAAVSIWLNAGVAPTQVAEWAGHSVQVLMRVYAKCVYGQEDAARRRIEAALREQDRQS
ncbi:integrase [Hamadaea flava]|uniref:Tyrosine-type recombinase/integrase n=1 Tax=Hamadaea flava TaxID=1742688 RepID=A0ABV8LHH3_9ACTN|nr:tyrosine-type recombinase/integrase [Hamadaea flava]MCP2325645.1 integrase [Hamadaea flava]